MGRLLLIIGCFAMSSTGSYRGTRRLITDDSDVDIDRIEEKTSWLREPFVRPATANRDTVRSIHLEFQWNSKVIPISSDSSTRQTDQFQKTRLRRTFMDNIVSEDMGGYFPIACLFTVPNY